MAGPVCASCSSENPQGARFCMSCGATLERRCPSCGEAAPPEARFCMACGAQLDGAAAVESGTTTASGAPEQPMEERRQVTVLFADVSGYTAIAERMDPEAVKTMISGVMRRLEEEVERYCGTVDKYIGDNVMALFGAPVAHEDDAERAVRAGLGMQASMPEINERLEARYGVSLALRVGVNTGEVLAGAVGDAYTVTGDTVNVASRLQTAGEPGSVLVGERTYRATAEMIAYRPLGALDLKGKSEPVPAWEAVEPIAAQPSRRAPSRRETPLIGRADELALLRSIYGRVAREGRPHLVTLIGQAGVGKSRLLRESMSMLSDQQPEPVVREGRCLPYGSSIVFWPLAEVVRGECGIVDGDDAEVAWGKLSTHLGELLREAFDEPEESSARKTAVIGSLLGIEPPEGGNVDAEDPQRIREQFFSAVRSSVEAIARRSPLVLAFEDIHWADHGMLDLIEYLAGWVRAPLLVLCLARDELLERRTSWGGGRRGASSIFLEPLSEQQTRELVAALLPDERARGELAPAVAERAGGNPFFAEEMVRMLAEEGTEGADLPDTVQGLLAARLDSLDPFERRLVQQAAVVGRTFWEESLEAVAAEEGRDLQPALATLQDKDIIVPQAGNWLAGEPELAFKHVLIRDVAYAMLPQAVRARKHFEVGDFLEQRAGDRSDEVVALLAEHYGRAAALASESQLPGEQLAPIHDKALRFLEAAGDAAAAFFSNNEAFSHYQSARELGAAHDPAVLARIGEKQGDVALRLGRVDAAIAVWGECLEHHQGKDSLARVADLHRKIGAGLWHKGERKQAIEHHQQGINLLKDGEPCLELVRLYEEAAWLYMQTGDNMLAIYAAEKSLRLAERLGETRAASRAHGIFGRVFGRIGDTAKARENLERSVELARGSNASEAILALLALGHHLEMFEADYRAAATAYADGLAQAEEIGDVPAQVELQSALAQLSVYRGDWSAVEEASDAAARLSEREGLVGKLCLPHALRGLLRWRDGDWDAAEELFRGAAKVADQVGWSEVAFQALFGLGITLRDRGDAVGAVAALDDALEVCERAGLIAQSIQAASARAVTLSLTGRAGEAREAAARAIELAERLHYPAARAAAQEADGATANGAEAVERLRDAHAQWKELGRELDAARCELLLARALAEHEPRAAPRAFEAARETYERLGVGHLAMRARQLGGDSEEPSADAGERVSR
jgi:class 3 adenylate cyclase/tetratricopeptide (TPR) repeat protein